MVFKWLVLILQMDSGYFTINMIIGKEYYYVMRDYSYTDKRCLWKVCSRPIDNYNVAETWKSYLQNNPKNKKHRFFIISQTLLP